MKRVLPIIIAGAFLLVALIGAGTASAAAALCTANESPCAAANTLPAGTAIGGYAYNGPDPVTLKASNGLTFRCEQARIGVRTTAETGSPLPIEFGEAVLAECYLGSKTKCTASAGPLSTPSIIWAGTEGKGIILLGSSENPFILTMNCALGEGITCRWRAGSGASIAAVWNPVKGDAFSITEANMETQEGPVFWCGTEAKLNVKLDEASSHPGGPVYITQ